MKLIKPHQSKQWCDYCPPKTVRAVWRGMGYRSVGACEDHRPKLRQDEIELKARENDTHLTEADYATWMRL